MNTIYIRAFNLPAWGEVDGKWQHTGEMLPDVFLQLAGHFEESDIPAIRQCALSIASGDDLYETDLEEALEHTEVIKSSDMPSDVRSVGIVCQRRDIFEGDENRPKRWMKFI